MDLKALRKKRGFTQEKLALKTGLSRPYLTNLENKKETDPKLSTIKKLAAVFQVTEQFIIDCLEA